MHSIKKFFPFNIIIILVVFVLGVFIIPRYDDLFAKKSDNISKEFKHYESVLSQIKFETIKNKEISSATLSKGIVILNFWASWCRPCLEEFPSIVELRNKFTEDKVKIIAISSDEEADKKNVMKAIEKYKLNFDIVLDPNGVFTDKFMVSAIPVSIIYKDGKVIEVSKGAKDFMAEEFLLRIK